MGHLSGILSNGYKPWQGTVIFGYLILAMLSCAENSGSITAGEWRGSNEIAGLNFNYIIRFDEAGTYSLKGTFGGMDHEESGEYTINTDGIIVIKTKSTTSKEGHDGSYFKRESGDLDWYLDDGEYFMTLKHRN